MIANKRELQKGILIIALLFLGAIAVLFMKYRIDVFLADTSLFTFSYPSGFYKEDILVEVTTEKKGNIYYTEDGSEPDKNKPETTKEYTDAIILKAEDTEQVRVLRFKEYFPDGTTSDTETNTYVIGKQIDKRYDTLVMNITTNPDNLYGYENGIFVEGKIRDDYLKENPGAEINSDTPCNYNLRGMESERTVHLEVFEPDGERVLSQDCGIRTSGGATRESEQKSFKLYSRDIYSENNKFKYSFFMDELQAEEHTVVGEYETLKVRNTGNDRMEAFIRDELGMRLVEQAGLQDVQYVRPVSVYFNGKYNGLYWIHSVYEDSYFKQRYGDYTGKMVVLGQKEGEMSTDSNKDIENQYAEEYNTWYHTVSELDMNQEENYKQVTDTIDVANFLQYMAAEVYMANQDWPFNNEKIYRYVAENGDYQKDSVFDGRYRYLIYDTDTSMGSGMIVDTMNASQSFEALQKLVENPNSLLFAALMKREDCREAFVSELCSLMNGAFSYENVCKTLDEMDAERAKEMRSYIKESEENDNLMDISAYYTEMQMDCIKEWARVTPQNLMDHLQSYWELGEQYKLGIVTSQGVSAKVNDLPIYTNEFIGTYFTGCKTVLHAVVPEGRNFVCWQINGGLFYDEDVELTSDMVIDGVIYAVMLVSDSENHELTISSYSAKGANDYIIITNNSSHDVETAGYYVADKEKVSHMNYLPETVLEPGKKLKILCKSYFKECPDADMRTNFDMKVGEQVILGHSQKGIIENVKIPHLRLDNGCYKRNLITGDWKEILDEGQ